MVTDKEKIQLLEEFHNGKSFRAFDFFGCHKITDKKYVFRVWAPHAKSVSVIGNFSDKIDRVYTMYRLADDESYEVELNASPGDEYAYLIETYDGRKLEKTDPYSFSFSLINKKSVVCDLPEPFENNRIFQPLNRNEPVNIYEVNLLSWKRHKDNSYYTYSELAQELVPYIKEMGYTHVEFMPVSEFPFDGSWGYQVTGYFAITSRLGSIKEFVNLIHCFHENGIKVILDWVPAHFPKDEWALFEFDGEPLYESALWDRMEHRRWGTRRFDFGKNEVNSFLLSNAYFFFEKFCVDGLRVDAVASMLYLDYDKDFGDYTPNQFGDNRDLDAINFLKKLNLILKTHFPGALIAAEESTVFEGVTCSVQDGGLGFDYKWNMGWMNDILFYCRQDPYFRNYHHNKVTFSLVYAFSEHYILPLSHDEVVHVKGSIVNKMPGDYFAKFAGERALLGYMYAHPGKKLNFMGYEIAQFKEWDYRGEIEYYLTAYEQHSKMQEFVKQLNFFYKSHKALYEIDDSWDGFEWLVVDDKFNNVITFSRYAKDRQSITAVINFSGVDLIGYNIGIDRGRYRLVFNTDDSAFGGNGTIKKKIFVTKKLTSNNKEYSISIDIPKLTCMYLIKEK